MNFHKKNQLIKLYSVRGKSASTKSPGVKVGVIPVGTHPDSIPAEIVAEISPRELAELRRYLEKDLEEILVARVSAVVGELNEFANINRAKDLKEESAELLRAACKSLLKTLTKTKPKTDTETPDFVIDIPATSSS